MYSRGLYTTFGKLRRLGLNPVLDSIIQEIEFRYLDYKDYDFGTQISKL